MKGQHVRRRRTKVLTQWPNRRVREAALASTTDVVTRRLIGELSKRLTRAERELRLERRHSCEAANCD